MVNVCLAEQFSWLSRDQILGDSLTWMGNLIYCIRLYRTASDCTGLHQTASKLHQDCIRPPKIFNCIGFHRDCAGHPKMFNCIGIQDYDLALHRDCIGLRTEWNFSQIVVYCHCIWTTYSLWQADAALSPSNQLKLFGGSMQSRCSPMQLTADRCSLM